MNEIFQFFENPVYEFRSGVHLPSSRTVSFGTESIILQPRSKIVEYDP